MPIDCGGSTCTSRNCPFCGSGNLALFKLDVSRESTRLETKQDEKGSAVGCRECGSFGPISDSSIRAIWLWDVRDENERREQGKRA